MFDRDDARKGQKLKSVSKGSLSVLSAFIVVSCSGQMLDNAQFTTEPLKSREDLLHVSHSGQFLIYYDRTTDIARGVVERSDIGNIPLRSLSTFDFESPDEAMLWKALKSDVAVSEECESSLQVDKKLEPDRLWSNFENAVYHFRKLGYPIAATNYIENEAGFSLSLTYFSECNFLESDLKEMVNLVQSG